MTNPIITSFPREAFRLVIDWLDEVAEDGAVDKTRVGSSVPHRLCVRADAALERVKLVETDVDRLLRSYRQAERKGKDAGKAEPAASPEPLL